MSKVDNKIKDKEKIRVTVNLNQGMVENLDEYAERMGISRSAAVSVLINQAFNQENAFSVLERTLQYMDNGQIKVDR